jgi:hypothetical protein
MQRQDFYGVDEAEKILQLTHGRTYSGCSAPARSWAVRGEEVRLQRDMTHRTVARAKRAAAREHTPVIVRLRSGRYDWYPSGNGIPIGSRVVSRWSGERWIDGP